MFKSKISVGAAENLPHSWETWRQFFHGPSVWKVMRRNAWKDIANWRTKQLNSYTKSQHHALMTTKSRKKKWDICRRFVKSLLTYCEKCLYLARIGRLDILWFVNTFTRAITKWTKACDKRLARLISYIHHTSEFWQHCYVGNPAQQCRLGLFQDSDFAGDLEDSKSTSGGVWCIFGSPTFVPISWMCKKQTSVSHSSTEAEVISLDAGFRMDAIFALDLWDFVIEVFHSSPNQINKSKGQESQGNLSRNTTLHMKNQNPTKHVSLIWIMYVSSNVRPFQFGAILYIFKDNEAVIKMIIKGRSPTMRHVSRTHRVALDWLFDRINQDPKIQIRYIDTKHQLADNLTKGNFTRDEWNNLLHLFNISHFSSLCCTQFYRSWNYFSRCRFTHGWHAGSWSLRFVKRSVQSSQTNSTPKIKYNREACPVIPHQTSTPKTKLRFLPTQHDWTMLTVRRWTRSLLDLVRCCTSLRTTKSWLKWSSKAEVQQWDMNPQSCSWLVVRQNWSRSQNLNQACRHQTPTRRHIDTRNFARDECNNLLYRNNISDFCLLCCSQNFSFSSCTKKMAKRMQEQKGEDRIVAKSKPTTMNLAVTVPTTSSTVQNPAPSKSPGILKALCRTDWSSTGKPDAKDYNRDAASSSQGWQKMQFWM